MPDGQADSSRKLSFQVALEASGDERLFRFFRIDSITHSSHQHRESQKPSEAKQFCKKRTNCRSRSSTVCGREELEQGRVSSPARDPGISSAQQQQA